MKKKLPTVLVGGFNISQIGSFPQVGVKILKMKPSPRKCRVFTFPQ